MATPCPQGYNDVEFPEATINMMVAADLAAWDDADGVHKLTPEGIEWVERLGKEMPA